MPYSTIVPSTAKPVANYKMATRTEGGRLVYVSGQVAWNAQGDIVGVGDIRAQAQQVFRNLRRVLQAAGGDFNDLIKITTYVTNAAHVPAIVEERSKVFAGELPASTLIVVQGLFHPDFLLEVEGVAVIG
jgi:enamine deaminase RidA (YjgF/YER057c/UK114 family)